MLGRRYAHGFREQEIAAALERPVNTVQSQLQRGAERLRRMLPGEAGLAALAAVSTDGLGAVRAQVFAVAAEPAGIGAVEVPGAPPGLGPELVALRVVEAGTLRPVLGARVTAWGADPLARIDALAPRAWPEAMLELAQVLEAHQLRFGTVHTADATGLVDVPESRAWGPMTARWGGLYGERGGDESDRIVVAPDRELRLRVVDLAGQPAVGLELGLGDGTRGGHQPPGGRWSNRARTGGEGLARIPHAQVPALELGERRGRLEMVVVAFAPGLYPTPLHRIPLGGLLPAARDLRPPPAGTAEVRVRDARGALVGAAAHDRLEVSVQAARGEATSGASSVPTASRASRSSRSAGSCASALGSTATRARRANSRAPASTASGSNSSSRSVPARRPSTAEPSTRPGARSARVAGGVQRGGNRVDTAADGRLRLVVPLDDTAGGSLDLELHRIALRLRGPIELDERLLGRVAVLRGVPAQAGTAHEAGDLVFAEPARLGSGT